jgi:type I restriction enzyme S subunit
MIHELKSYPAYRDSGVEWLGDVPEGWLTKPLKRCVTINGRTLEEDTNPSFRFRYIDIGTVGPGRLVQEPQRTSFGDAPSRARRVLRRGDTIVSTVRAYLKAVWHVREDVDDLIASTGFAVLSPDRTIEPEYLGYVIQSDSFVVRVVANSVGVAYPAISETALGRLQIVCPPLGEQSAIVRFLDHVDRRIRRCIRAKQKLIALLHEQRQAIIHRAVTRGLDPNVRLKPSGVEWLGDVPEHWQVAALRFRYSQCLGKMLDTKRILGVHSLAYVRNVDVQWDRINTAGLPMMDISPNEYQRYTVRSGDLLVCEGGEVGRSAIWNGDLARCGFQKALHRLRPLSCERDLPRFLLYALRVASKAGAFDDGHQSTIAHLTGDKLRAHRFAFPPKAEQVRIVAHLDREVGEIDRTVMTVGREIALLREYRTRLIADVVTGKLDVREAAAHLPEETGEPEPLDDTDTSPEDISEEIEATDPDADLDDILKEAEA